MSPAEPILDRLLAELRDRLIRGRVPQATARRAVAVAGSMVDRAEAAKRRADAAEAVLWERQAFMARIVHPAARQRTLDAYRPFAGGTVGSRVERLCDELVADAEWWSLDDVARRARRLAAEEAAEAVRARFEADAAEAVAAAAIRELSWAVREGSPPAPAFEGDGVVCDGCDGAMMAAGREGQTVGCTSVRRSS